MTSAFGYYKTSQVELESIYPYKAVDQDCQYDKETAIDVNVLGYYNVKQRSVKDLKSAVAKKPVSIGIDADSFAF